MPVDPRTPVLVGAAQVVQRRDEHPDPRHARDPLELMLAAVTGAAHDSGAPGLLRHVGLVAVVAGLWSWPDPGRLIAERIGAGGARTLLTTFGGQSPQYLVADLAGRIRRGDLELALVCGGEANDTRDRLRRAGHERNWPRQDPDISPDEVFGDPLGWGEGLERQLELDRPTTAYALIGSAIRARRGEDIETNRRRIGALWERFARVAATNPHAWDRSAPDVDAIVTPRPDNRMVAFPYTKALCANNRVDMASALVLTSLHRARALGIARDRMVFPLGAVRADDTPTILDRGDLSRVPALEAAVRALGDLTGLGTDDIDVFELYACFPSLVELSTEALGLRPDDPRPPTVTGGLGFAGAPLNNAAGQGLAALVHAVRSREGRGLLHANGGAAANKHGLAVYGVDPPEVAFREERVVVDPVRRPLADHDTTTSGVVEAVTVVHDRERPPRTVGALRLDDGRRCWFTDDDPALAAAAESRELVGTRLHRRPDGSVAA